jgi:hypothetical protein
MAAVIVIAVLTIGLAVVLAALLPGAGLIGAIVVVMLGIGLIVWLILAGASDRAPSDIVHKTGEPELLGPGGPDAPDR